MSTSSAKTTPGDEAAKASGSGAAMDLARMRRAPTHPGVIFFEDTLEGAYGAQAAAARAMGWSTNRMNEWIKGKRPLTLEGALDLAEYTGTSAEFWLRLQMRHDLWHAMQARTGESKTGPKTRRTPPAPSTARVPRGSAGR